MVIKKFLRYIKDEHELYVITMAGVLIRDNKALIAQLALDSAAGYWDIPGGRLNKNEDESGFRREIKEELGIDNFEILGVIDHDIWTPVANYPVCAIVHLIKNDTDEIKLSFEHKDFKWISECEITDYEFFWPKAHRFLKKAFEYDRMLKYKLK